MDFTIPDAEVKLGHLNVRIEKRGEDDITAVDLKLHWLTSNEALDMFHPDLREALYAPDPGQQKKIAGIPPVLRNRLFPSLAPLHWTTEATNRQLVIRWGIDGQTDIVIGDCTADKFFIQPLEGGTVDITLRVRAVCVDERVLGKLPLLLNRTLPMQLTAADNE